MQARCPDCGARVESRSDTPRPCLLCRCADRIEVTDELRDWWLDRYTPTELSELAAPIWPDARGQLLARTSADRVM